MAKFRYKLDNQKTLNDNVKEAAKTFLEFTGNEATWVEVNWRHIDSAIDAPVSLRFTTGPRTGYITIGDGNAGS